ncbi:delphilin-like isoform X2 [Pomacea canaliculata]|uniref:delphilin-like isoform X2 n=1 Tax=Pomacea canaliculata TaxID=400727 RepID=UPI000D733CBF|nr:delphilin-like isoform X2 [Pomacea canaliculata]
MPLKFLQRGAKWPKSYGFEIYGSGPTYVVSVEKGSTACRANLRPGDQILEVEGQDVTTMSASAVKNLARESRTQPPSLEVVSCLARLILEPVPLSGYGFSVLNERPVVVGSVDFGGPAYQAGLRVGDIILEVNGTKPEGVETVGTILSQRSGRLSMLTIPAGRLGNLVLVDKRLNQLPPSDLRVHRARDLYEKLASVLGDDYDRKMAVVAVLKQYAEDRDIDILCRSLAAILQTPHQRTIIRYIRALVSPNQRAAFDELLTSQILSPAHSNRSGHVTPVKTTHVIGVKKVVQVLRENESFGFVVKGCNPAFIESVDEFGPADRAGLCPGDFIVKLNGLDVRRCDHDRLVQLLQDSGYSPTLQVLRCRDDQQAVLSPSSSLSSLSSSSSESSHGSDFLPDEDVHVDSDGTTFSERAQYLLTARERNQLKKALQSYELNRDVISLHASLEPVLDTPSKCILWKFILVCLQSHHRDYILHRVDLPREVVTELVSGETRSFKDHTIKKEYLGKRIISGGGGGSSRHLDQTSFQRHVDFLLTSTERVQFKKALQAYHEKQDIKRLAEVMNLLLDTPSKRILWRYVIPRLSPAHQGVVRKTLDIPDSHSGVDAKNADRDDDITSLTSDEESDISEVSELSSERNTATGRDQGLSRIVIRSGEDQAHMRELQITRQAVEEANQAVKSKTEGKEVFITHSDDDEDNDSDEMDYLKSRRYVTIIPVGYPGFSLDRRPFYSREMDQEEFFSFRKGMEMTVADADSGTRVLRSTPGVKRSPTVSPPSVMRGKDASSSESEEADQSVTRQQTRTKRSTETYGHGERKVLKELEDVMASEISDLDSPSQHQHHRHQQPVASEDTEVDSTRPPVVPPPPPPPPPPPGGPLTSGQVAGQHMNIKRINWEKLDNSHVENTVWEQMCDQDLSEVIRYLELESQFSTKPSRTRDLGKKKEICIMSSKKAYNISILLGHLKMTVAEIKRAIFLMDEDTLTPELLRQLIAYSPSKQEKSEYDAFKGDVEDLSKPDQFAYEMSQVYAYERRLMALLFKACFREKIDEMKESLRSIRVASNELRHSKRLARILELILAMGNHLNKGNNRVGEAAGFRITFLTQLDITKTADSKSTFLHVLTDTIYKKFPELLAVREDLGAVAVAAKVSNLSLNEDMQELKKGLQDVSTTLEEIGSHCQTTSSIDHFPEVIGRFIAHASDEIQSIFRQQATAMHDFSTMVSFFGEDPRLVTTSDVFSIFHDFIEKFEKAHRHNVIYRRR